MTTEDEYAAAIAFLDMGQRDIHFFQMGPGLWENLPPNVILEENVPEYLTACLINEDASSKTIADTKRAALHVYVDSLVDAFEEWARDTGRDDLLLTVGQRLEQAVKQ
ncbi:MULTISPECIES: hypothetical protein [Arthrobacter]|uniref:Uncharacterized protein n=1 Tax=Arthrobacter terricola TaxID=2547396 RepID=A0A4R5KQ82_9MICC|nr:MULTISPECIES: hypothetical protein [Arthrobacter]MBT8161038.1 hypothetical protein [Arthrobacter sp. GN70]TDF96897.1 hypothetical protein E1809_09250 [Arthrobacter terricola]